MDPLAYLDGSERVGERGRGRKPREPSVFRECGPREPSVFRERGPREPSAFRERMPRERSVFRDENDVVIKMTSFR